MIIVSCRFVGALALLALLVGGVSCARTRPPTYVHTSPPGETVETRSRRTTEPRTSPRAPAPIPATVQVAEREETADTGRGGFFRRRKQPSTTEPVRDTRRANNEMADYIPDDIRAVSPGYRLQINDPLIIQLRGIPDPESANYEMVVDDMGFIHMPYISPVRAEGRTPSELQREIRDVYIGEQIYRHITVHVMLPTQSYFVRGEVRQPGRYPLTSSMTVLKAIAAAGGYSEFANPRRINIIRAGETMVENARQMEQNPEDDMDVKAGDVIIVPRSIF